MQNVAFWSPFFSLSLDSRLLQSFKYEDMIQKLSSPVIKSSQTSGWYNSDLVTLFNRSIVKSITDIVSLEIIHKLNKDSYSWFWVLVEQSRFVVKSVLSSLRNLDTVCTNASLFSTWLTETAVVALLLIPEAYKTICKYINTKTSIFRMVGL